MKEHKPSGLKSVAVALTGNVLVGIVKIFAFILSGSSVMLSEGIHSIADSGNQIFLLIGIFRSQKPADDKFNYGYRSERFFWSLLSACGVFFVGAGVTIYHGIESIQTKETFHLSYWSIIILLFAFALDAYSLLTAFREVKQMAGREKIFNYFAHSGDPTLLAIIYEDAAALIGVVIALLSIWLSQLTGWVYWDPIGSILIGVLLGSLAIVLMNVNRELLIGRSIPQHVRKKIFTILLNEGVVDEIHDFKTVMLTTDGYRVKAEIEINGHYLADKIFESREFKKEYEEIHDYQDFVRFCAAFSDEVTRTLGKEIDKLEAEVESEVPLVKYIDIEAN